MFLTKLSFWDGVAFGLASASMIILIAFYISEVYSFTRKQKDLASNEKVEKEKAKET
jgi:hypothetical protein